MLCASCESLNNRMSWQDGNSVYSSPSDRSIRVAQRCAVIWNRFASFSQFTELNRLQLSSASAAKRQSRAFSQLGMRTFALTLIPRVASRSFFLPHSQTWITLSRKNFHKISIVFRHFIKKCFNELEQSVATRLTEASKLISVLAMSFPEYPRQLIAQSSRPILVPKLLLHVGRKYFRMPWRHSEAFGRWVFVCCEVLSYSDCGWKFVLGSKWAHRGEGGLSKEFLGEVFVES